MKIARIFAILALVLPFCVNAQQDPQVTHYMYNTMTVNPAYTGSREHIAAIALFRDQWVGIDGSPRTLTVGVDSPLGPFNGVGLSIVQDQLGPASETYVDGNYAHQLVVNRRGHRLALGLKAGVRFFSVDWAKGIFRDQETRFNENINSKLLPTLGAGAFFYTRNAYFGLSTPNIFSNKHYDEIQEAEAVERLHLFGIAGYVFDINRELKFKPSVFLKHVSGAPISVDVSANFLLNQTLNLGVNYRWDDSISGLFGFQVTPKFSFGYAYDYSINDFNSYNNGTHEIFLRYKMVTRYSKLKSPRFF